MDIIEQEIQELNADGVDFVSCGACLKDGKFIGEIYESYTKEEFKQCEGYPRSSRLYWFGTKENKEYINIPIRTTYKFADAIKLLEEGKVLTSPFIDFLELRLITVDIDNEFKKILTLGWSERINGKMIHKSKIYNMPADILFSDGWEVLK